MVEPHSERRVPRVPAHEQFEREHRARDRDARRPKTVEQRWSGARARDRVERLVDDGLVVIHHAEQVLTHRPTGRSFGDAEPLVLFHEGWRAAQDEECRQGR